MFGAGTFFTTTLVNDIRANTILAISTIAFDMMQLQYIFDPKIYTKPDGMPISIIGNASNKMGKFSLVHLHMIKIALFPCVIQKEATNVLPLGKDIPPELLIDTSWANSNECYCHRIDILGILWSMEHVVFGQRTGNGTPPRFGRASQIHRSV